MWAWSCTPRVGCEASWRMGVKTNVLSPKWIRIIEIHDMGKRRMKRSNREKMVVYTTEHGRMCPDCGRPKSRCICRSRGDSLSFQDPIRIRYEIKGRKGKGVTIVEGLPVGAPETMAFLQEMKRSCGSGGTIKNGLVMIQGDHRKLLEAECKKRGFIS